MSRASVYDRLALARLRRLHARRMGWGSAVSGYDGLVDEVRHELEHTGHEEIERAARQVLADFFTRPVLAVGRIVSRHRPELVARLFVHVTPVSFRFLVGPIRRVGPTDLVIPRCRFLADAGPEACIRMCQRPTESLFADMVGLEFRLEPDHARGSCRIYHQGGTCPETSSG